MATHKSRLLGSSGSGSGGGGFSHDRLPRLTWVLTAIVSCVLLLQLSGLSKHQAANSSVSDCGRNSSSSRAEHLLPVGLAAPTVTTTAAAGAQQQQDATDKNAWHAALGPPPYRLPRIIHQTVVNKSRLSCQEKALIDGWKRINPNHTHRLWDDEDMRQFMLEFYPELVPVPYDELVSGTERSDLWRVLVLHKYGGVYADMDVECLVPVDEWNAQHNHDAALLLGIENYVATRKPHRMHVTNWAMASMPGHPLLALMPGVVARETQKQFYALARQQGALSAKVYEDGVLDRTGPAAFTTALYDYAASVGVDLNSFSEADTNSERGVLAGSVRVLPLDALGSGWEVAQARSKGYSHTCADVAAAKPKALVCHMFWGSWRSTWRSFKPKFTYEDC